MKIRLSATITPEEWKSSFFVDGIKKGDLTSQECETKAGRILVQCAEDPFHHWRGRLLVVEFWKEDTEVFLDPDVWEIDREAGEKSGAFDGGRFKVEESLDSYFGSYVNEIKWHEIIKVYPVIEGSCPCPEECCVMYTHDKKQVSEPWCEWKKKQPQEIGS